MADPLRPSGPQIPGSLMGEIQSEVAVEATPVSYTHLTLPTT